jgi:alpha-tubulin suppressor-like RCC1 family protein
MSFTVQKFRTRTFNMCTQNDDDDDDDDDDHHYYDNDVQISTLYHKGNILNVVCQEF